MTGAVLAFFCFRMRYSVKVEFMHADCRAVIVDHNGVASPNAGEESHETLKFVAPRSAGKHFAQAL